MGLIWHIVHRDRKCFRLPAKSVSVRRQESSSLDSCPVGIQVSHGLLTESSSRSGFIDGPTERPTATVLRFCGSAGLPHQAAPHQRKGSLVKRITTWVLVLFALAYLFPSALISQTSYGSVNGTV